MTKEEKIIQELSDNQKSIIQHALEPSSIILFNIKGMIQVLHQDGPFDFIEMGYEDIEILKKKKLIETKRGSKNRNVLQGEEYVLSPLGEKIANALKI